MSSIYSFYGESLNPFQCTFTVSPKSSTSFSVQSLEADSQSQTGSSSIVLVGFNVGPIPGRLTVSPESGFALETQFLIEASSWTGRYEPLTYSFLFVQGNTVLSVAAQLTSGSFLTVLPEGRWTPRLVISDSLQTQHISEINSTVVVVASQNTTSCDLVERLNSTRKLSPSQQLLAVENFLLSKSMIIGDGSCNISLPLCVLQETALDMLSSLLQQQYEFSFEQYAEALTILVQNWDQNCSDQSDEIENVVDSLVSIVWEDSKSNSSDVISAPGTSWCNNLLQVLDELLSWKLKCPTALKIFDTIRNILELEGIDSIVDENEIVASLKNFKAILKRTSFSSISSSRGQIVNSNTTEVNMTDSALNTATSNCSNSQGSDIIVIQTTILEQLGCLNGSTSNSSIQVIGTTLQITTQTPGVNGTQCHLPSQDGNTTVVFTIVEDPTDGGKYRCNPREIVCAWYNQTSQSWSSDGCRKISENKTTGGNVSVTCACTHLTDFAVLYEWRLNETKQTDECNPTSEIGTVYWSFFFLTAVFMGIFCYACKRIWNVAGNETVKIFAHMMVGEVALFRIGSSMLYGLQISSSASAYALAAFAIVCTPLLYTLETVAVLSWREIVHMQLQTSHIPIVQKIRFPMLVTNLTILIAWCVMVCMLMFASVSVLKTIFIATTVFYMTAALCQSLCFAVFGIKLYRKVKTQVVEFAGKMLRGDGAQDRMSSANRIFFCGLGACVLVLLASLIWMLTFIWLITGNYTTAGISYSYFANLVLEILVLIMFLVLYKPPRLIAHKSLDVAK
eukprot:TRINITY_DN23511_c0_g4_i1.p1 TRINITY_DN23511_c0_g4~~TRINITY_DN23511_c0_g4_i1.p1  ORF type:complete len:792 (-),score=149.30 TRINITY_DN23511_c0_g4_i1:42-2417(-)